ALPAPTARPVGLITSPARGLGTMRKLTSVFTTEDGTLMQQTLVPLPADWSALRALLLALDGVRSATIDVAGVIRVNLGDIELRGLMDYVVIPASGTGPGTVVLEAAGDTTGNGMHDYRVTYANG